jgi:hypothetical protein
MGLADQTVVQGLEAVRSYRALERALIGSVDPRQHLSLRSLTGWQACCGDFVAPARSKPACLRSRPNLSSHASKPPRAEQATWGRCKLSLKPMATEEPLARTDDTISPPSMRLRGAAQSKSRAIAQCFLGLSNVGLTLLDRAGSYEARCGVKRRKPSGPLKKSDGRHRLRRDGGFGNRQGLIGMPSAETEMRPPGYRRSK